MKQCATIDILKMQLRLAQDDQGAFRVIYDYYGARLFQFAYSIVHSREMTEEIVEDVFVQIWEKRCRLKTIENFSFYLYVTTRNISISYLRKWRNKKHINFDEVELSYFRLDISPEDIMISGEIIQRINTAINKLPSQCQLIFKLVKEDGLKYKEVAELMNISIKTVENQIGIALKKIHASVNIQLPQTLR